MSESVYKLTYSNLSPPVVSLFCLSSITGKRQGKVILSGSQEAQLPRFHYSEQSAGSLADSYAEADDISVARSICVTVPACRPFLGVQEASLGCQRVQIEHWVDVTIKLLAEAQATAQFDFAKARYHREVLLQLEQHLASRTFIVGHKLSLADVALFFHFGTLFGFVLDSVLQREDLGMHTRRWWSYVFSVNPINPKVMNAVRMAYPGRFQSAARVVNAKPSIDSAPGNADRSTKRSCYEGKLPGAVQGKVVTRFPPEPSGYLHIGHAKAALLNAYYARLYGGKLLIRFDDTNPAKENMEYEQSIFEDLKLLDINVSEATRTSDYFEYLQTLCEDMLRKGLFYVDNTPVDLMRQQRGEGIESVCRSHSVEQNLDLWNKMKEGTPEGTACCVRAKMNMQDKNKCLRDPVMYRCIVDIPHHIHGFKYKAYPTYDFACPVVDSLEGVTHAMRTNEYSDRIPQYQWVLDNCGLRHVTIYEFSRLNFVNTVLSKRKLQWFVDQGIVESWEDPRFPTVRGVRRRGLTVDALREFVLEQGPSKNTNLMEWDKLWAKNKQILDPILPRYTAVAATAIPAVLVNGPPSPTSQTRDLHPKNPSVGKGTQVYSSSILLDYDDAITLQQHEEITLMRWCNAIVESITYHEGQPCQITMRLHHDGDFKKTKKKLHWVASEAVLPAVLREFDHLITKKKLEDQDTIEQYCNKNSVFDTEALIEKDTLETLQHGACLQFERRGYFRLDALPRDDGTPAVFIKIPDGRSKNMSVVTSKVDAGVLAKGV